MVDRQQVIKDLESIMRKYAFMTSGELQTLAIAIEILKAQERVRPVRIVEHAQGADIVWYECGGCGGLLGAGKEVKNVCPGCGKAVKWDA